MLEDPSTDVADVPPFDGSPGWRADRVLPDGGVVTIRGIVPEDREELRRGLAGLSPESRYFRFLHLGVSEPTEHLLTYLTAVDQKRHVALAASVTSPDLKTDRGVGIARFVRLDGQPDTAEAAVTVVDDMHRRGIGTALLRELLRAAELRGITTLRAEVLADNESMRTILERAGAQKVAEESGQGTIAYDLALERVAPSSSSVFGVLRQAAEAMAERFRR